jgi:hypothetical protein
MATRKQLESLQKQNLEFVISQYRQAHKVERLVLDQYKLDPTEARWKQYINAKNTERAKRDFLDETLHTLTMMGYEIPLECYGYWWEW